MLGSTTPVILHFNGEEMKVRQHIRQVCGPFRAARRRTLGEEGYQAEVQAILGRTLQLSNGSRPTFRELCPNYREFYDQWEDPTGNRRFVGRLGHSRNTQVRVELAGKTWID